jgi:Mg2+ and Co2+ transporter CorA
MEQRLILGERPSIDRRTTYLQSLCTHYFSELISSSSMGVPNPLEILQYLCRLVISEWAVTLTYIQREINTIEWKLENGVETSLETFNTFLQQLDTQRRRIIKYETLIQEQKCFWEIQKGGNTIFSHLPSRETATTAIATSVVKDYAEIHKLSGHNIARINQSIDIITARMAVQGARFAIKQNESLQLLAVVATIFLPFNAVASVLAMPEGFAPGKESFWVFWAVAAGLLVVILTLYLARKTWIKFTVSKMFISTCGLTTS